MVCSKPVMMAIQLSLSMSVSLQTGDGERRPDARACTRGGLRPALEPMTSCPRCGWTLCALVVLGRAVRHHAVLLNSPGAGREVVRGALNGAGGGLVGHSYREATIFTAAICWYLQVAGHALRTALGVGARGQHGAVVARAGVCPRCRVPNAEVPHVFSTSYSNRHGAAGTAGFSLLRWVRSRGKGSGGIRSGCRRRARRHTRSSHGGALVEGSNGVFTSGRPPVPSRWGSSVVGIGVDAFGTIISPASFVLGP